MVGSRAALVGVAFLALMIELPVRQQRLRRPRALRAGAGGLQSL